MDYCLDSELLILEVKKHPCLYDITVNPFKNRDLKNETWTAVTKALVGEEWDQMDEETRSIVRTEVPKRWKNLKDTFFRSLRKAGKGEDGKKAKKPYMYHKHMAFIQEVYEQKTSWLSATGYREEEEKEDHTPPESAIEIKEEPENYRPTPSTSTNTTNEEYILPHEENSWITPDPVVEPQFTLSVASLAPTNVQEASNGEQLKKKRKATASTMPTFVPSTNMPEAIPQNPVNSFVEFSNLDSSKEPRKDQFDAFGEYIAAKLRSLDRRSSAFAQRAIADIVFEAEMGKFLNLHIRC